MEVDWKYRLTVYGELFVMTTGVVIKTMLMLPVDNLVTLEDLFHITFLYQAMVYQYS